MSDQHSKINVHVGRVQLPTRQITTSRELGDILAAWKRHEVAEAWKKWTQERFGDQAAFVVLFVNDEVAQAWHIVAFNDQQRQIGEDDEPEGTNGLPVPHSSEGLPEGWSEVINFGIDSADTVLIDFNMPAPPMHYAAP